MKADAATEAEVMDVVKRYGEFYVKRDMEGLLSLFARDADVACFGSGPDEKRIGIQEIKAQIERDWAQSESASFKITWSSVSSAGSVAWAAVEESITASVKGKEKRFMGRLTAVLEKREGKWLLVQSHFSIPPEGQTEGQSWPA